MAKDMKTRLIIAVVAIVVVIVVGSEYRRQQKDSVRQIEGTITAIDVAARQASVEFVHPKSGQRFQLAGDVPADCEIRIDDKPATLADLKVGDVVQVKGTMGDNRRVTATAVWATRSTPTATAPAAASRPAGAP
jgi:hypothetical protein